jgi:hypothetical protein
MQEMVERRNSEPEKTEKKNGNYFLRNTDEFCPFKNVNTLEQSKKQPKQSFRPNDIIPQFKQVE